MCHDHPKDNPVLRKFPGMISLLPKPELDSDEQKRSENVDPSRRHIERYNVQLTTRFFWTQAEQQQMSGEGMTRDISSTGLYVRTATCPPLHAFVRFEMSLPKTRTASDLRICGCGEVCRVDDAEDIKGFAVVNTRKFRVSRVSPRGWTH